MSTQQWRASQATSDVDALVNNAGVNVGDFRHLERLTKPTGV
jgi:hypothetical protein